MQTQFPLGFGEKLLLRFCSVSTFSKGRRWSGAPLSPGEWGSIPSYPESWDLNPFRSLSCFELQNAQILPGSLLSRVSTASPQASTGRSTCGEMDFGPWYLQMDKRVIRLLPYRQSYLLNEIVFFKLQTHFALLATLAPAVHPAAVLRALGPSVLGVATPWSSMPLQTLWLLTTLQ